MQREISDRAFLGQTVSPYENGGRSSAIDRTASNYDDAKEKDKKLVNLLVLENMTRHSKIHP